MTPRLYAKGVPAGILGARTRRAKVEEDTIVAVATPRGAAARGIVRLSGPRAAEIVSACLDGPLPAGTYLVSDARLRLPATGPFPVTVYAMRAPKSYTREDVVEVHAPGSPPLLAAIITEFVRRGARQAEPGEFTKRAFLNGRIDLAQAEAVLAVIRARSDEEERLALSSLGGDLSDEVRAIRARLISLAADVEAGLDFCEEAIVFADAARRGEEISAAAAAIRSILASSAARQVFREDVLAVFYGPVNAGKSSLFNMLAGAEHAIVSHVAGTTRDFLEAAVCVDGVSFILVDTAGVRAPAEVVEEMAIARSRRSVSEAQVVLFVVDGAEPVSPEVATLYEEARRLPHVAVINKADRPLAVTAAEWRRRFGEDAVEVSAATGAGREALETALAEAIHGGKVDLSGMRFYVAARQRGLLEEAGAALARAAEAEGAGDEIVAVELREAAAALGRLTGEDYADDVLDDIFARFCIGK
jgi:tRNA modification GTPase